MVILSGMFYVKKHMDVLSHGRALVILPLFYVKHLTILTDNITIVIAL